MATYHAKIKLPYNPHRTYYYTSGTKNGKKIFIYPLIYISTSKLIDE